MEKMKAAIVTKYGPPEVIKIKEIDKPTPQEDEVLIKVHATTVSSGDVRMRKFNVPFLFWLPFRLYMGLKAPKNNIPGIDVSGEIVAVGSKVSRFKIGDQVFGSTYDAAKGASAEFMTISESAVLAEKPVNLDFTEAAAIFFGAHTALHFLRKGNLQIGDKILIYGASGSIGTYAVQLAKYYGAEVTGVCSTTNLELVRSLGANKVIDYTKVDFRDQGETYDLIFDTVGKSPFGGCVKVLRQKGRYLRAVHLQLTSILRGLWVELTSSKKVIGGVAGETLEDLLFLKKLVEEEKIKPVIDRVYPLEDIVEANRYVEKGHKKGNVVIKISEEQ